MSEEVGREHVVVALLQHGMGDLNRSVVDTIRRSFEESSMPDPRHTTLHVWLDSPGGDANAAYKLGLLLRSVASRIVVVVPDYAKSAATLLSLVADEIFMSPSAELGPLDAQLNYEQEGLPISALDRARSVEDLIDTAMQIILGGGASVLNFTNLSRIETITAMQDFAAKFMQPVVAKLDPTIMHWSGTLLRVASEYGRRLMETRQAPLTERDRAIPSKLVDNYPTHGFIISIDEARKLGLPVKSMSDYEFARQALTLHHQVEEAQQNLVTVFPIGNTTNDDPVSSDENGDDDEDHDGNSDDRTGGGSGDSQISTRSN